MDFLETLRNKLFWFRDSVTGGKVKKHIRDIDSILSADTTTVAKEIETRLQSILVHAVDTTRFYSQLRRPVSLHDFPVINKNVIRENMDLFISSGFREDQRIPAITSGSTGTPFKVFHSREKKQRNTADTLYFARLGGYELGNKLYYYKIWSAYNRKDFFQKLFQNIVAVDVLNLQVNSAQVIAQLNRERSAVSFLGYVSAVETLCKALDKGLRLNPDVKVNSVITMSEAPNDYTKAAVRKYFSCPALSRYSNIENGIIAQQTLDNEHDFTVNTASYAVEIFDLHSDTPVPMGSPGRIVVTDYFNYAMPLIRYDTGDIGVLEEKTIHGRKRLVLSRIDGRRLDQIFNTKGELISSYIVYRNMWNYTEINQYQFIQKSKKEYVFRISMEGEFKREDALKREFMEYLGQDAVFTIEYVSEIPLLDSGKRRKVVNEMLQKGGN